MRAGRSDAGAALAVAPAVADGAIALLLLANPASRLPNSFLKSVRRPAVVLIGSDMGANDDPAPDQWQCVTRLRRWAQAAVIHAAGGEAAHYRAVVLAAQLHRRVVMVECASRQAQAWAGALRCPTTGLILPRGGQHPVMPAAGRMQ